VHDVGDLYCTERTQPRAELRNSSPRRASVRLLPHVRRLDAPLLRPDEAAALLAVKTSWIYDAVQTGRLPCLRIGRHIRFTRGMLEEWLGGLDAP
jgi:excisionase family DNA binding protein